MKKILSMTLSFICSIVFADPANDTTSSTPSNSGQPKLIMVKSANGSNSSLSSQQNNVGSKKSNKHNKSAKKNKKTYSKNKSSHKTKSTKQHKKQSTT